MKNHPPVLCLLLATLFSCQKGELAQVPANTYPQTWQLVEMRGQVPNVVQTGANLPWQEAYTFQADSTFTKTRQQDGHVAEAHGTFSYLNLSDGPYVVLTYAAPNSLIGACTTEPKETLAVKADGTLSSTWQACDGPGLEYKKVQQSRVK
ncbi:hypothetical protein MTX78_23430 (plasmid) [Hymenobacter tibetensis]|uniref:Lipocalin-like domain-containing protein n=1 Tax=Hymenobacter tibetensis TaxID=497967 RepID=A0ABY4D435_9BACT|nr:hypothetical protein [Hymenobacter tibetensis]UOG77301.1 hypothetical protein MTX78_23430 [Hymenobacter tibetensis]